MSGIPDGDKKCSECGKTYPAFYFNSGTICKNCLNGSEPNLGPTESDEPIHGQHFVEEKIRRSIIPTTKLIGIITGIILTIGLTLSGEIFTGIIAGVAYISSVIALCILLDGFAEIITLLRRIAGSSKD